MADRVIKGGHTWQTGSSMEVIHGRQGHEAPKIKWGCCTLYSVQCLYEFIHSPIEQYPTSGLSGRLFLEAKIVFLNIGIVA